MVLTAAREDNPPTVAWTYSVVTSYCCAYTEYVQATVGGLSFRAAVSTTQRRCGAFFD